MVEALTDGVTLHPRFPTVGPHHRVPACVQPRLEVVAHGDQVVFVKLAPHGPVDATLDSGDDQPGRGSNGPAGWLGRRRPGCRAGTF